MMPSLVKSRNETLIPKAIGSTNAEKKTLTATLQISHLFLQKLNTGVRNGNGSGSDRVFLYPDPTCGIRPMARTRPVN